MIGRYDQEFELSSYFNDEKTAARWSGPRHNPGHPDTIRSMHGDEGLVLVLSDFVDGTDVRMVQGESRPRFPLESFQGLVIGGKLVR